MNEGSQIQRRTSPQLVENTIRGTLAAGLKPKEVIAHSGGFVRVVVSEETDSTGDTSCDAIFEAGSD